MIPIFSAMLFQKYIRRKQINYQLSIKIQFRKCPLGAELTGSKAPLTLWKPKTRHRVSEGTWTSALATLGCPCSDILPLRSDSSVFCPPIHLSWSPLEYTRVCPSKSKPGNMGKWSNEQKKSSHPKCKFLRNLTGMPIVAPRQRTMMQLTIGQIRQSFCHRIHQPRWVKSKAEEMSRKRTNHMKSLQASQAEGYWRACKHINFPKSMDSSCRLQNPKPIIDPF